MMVDIRLLQQSTLHFAARIENGVVYQAIDFGPTTTAGSGRGGGQDGTADLENIVISPISEAATRVLDENGFDAFDTQGVREVQAAVSTAVSEASLANLEPAAAADVATETAKMSSVVQQAILENKLATPTPTATPTSTPTRTATAPAPHDGGEISCGQDATGSISPAGDTDFFTLTVASAGTVAVSVGTNDFDSVCVRLFGAGGQIATPNGIATLPAAGRYTIEVFECRDNPNDAVVSAYALNVHGLSAELTCGESLACNGDGVGALNPPGDTDTFSFVARDTGLVALTTGTADFDKTCVRLFAPDGTFVTIENDLAALPLPGVYTVEVFECRGAANDDVVTAYAVNVHGVSAELACGELISCSGDAGGAIAPPGDTDSFSFAVDEPGLALLTIGTDDFDEACVRLFAPDGTVVTVNDRTADLPEAGTYTVEVFECTDAPHDAVVSRYALSVQSTVGRPECEG